MKSFLISSKTNKPIISWGMLPDNIFYEGKIPEGYDLVINPHQPYIIVDVDRHEDKDGFKHLPLDILEEFTKTFNYATKRNGMHVWLYYTGNKTLINKASGLGIDLRIGWKKINKTEWVNGGYVKWHPRDTIDIRNCLHLIKETSPELNKWLETWFSYKD